MIDPFEQYEKRINELVRQRDALADACDELIDCLVSSPLSGADQAAIEIANAAIKVAEKERLERGMQ